MPPQEAAEALRVQDFLKVLHEAHQYLVEKRDWLKSKGTAPARWHEVGPRDIQRIADEVGNTILAIEGELLEAWSASPKPQKSETDQMERAKSKLESAQDLCMAVISLHKDPEHRAEYFRQLRNLPDLLDSSASALHCLWKRLGTA